jgi:hypothetical protein
VSGSANPGGGFPPGFDPAAFGLDPAAAAAIAAGGSGIPEPSPFEGGDGWIVTYTVTASGERTQTQETLVGLSTSTDTYSIRLQGSVPLNYGTPAAPFGPGPRWQLIPGIGSEAGNAAEMSFAGQSEYRSEGNVAAECTDIGDRPYTWTSTTTGTLELNLGPATSENPNAMMGIAYWQLSADGQTYELAIGGGGDATEVTEGMTNFGECPGSPASSEPIAGTATQQYSSNFSVTGQPLPTARQTITGSATLPLTFTFGDFEGELDALVEWTITEI